MQPAGLRGDLGFWPDPRKEVLGSEQLSLLLQALPSGLQRDEGLCLRIKHYPCLSLITRKLASCICSYSWFLSHLVYNNFKGNVFEKGNEQA